LFGSGDNVLLASTERSKNSGHRKTSFFRRQWQSRRWCFLFRSCLERILTSTVLDRYWTYAVRVITMLSFYVIFKRNT